MAGCPLRRARARALYEAIRPDADGNLILMLLLTVSVREAARSTGMRVPDAYRRFLDEEFVARYRFAREAMASGAMDRLRRRYQPLAARLQSNNWRSYSKTVCRNAQDRERRPYGRVETL
ncbi:MAG TPA: hypothetical protein VKU00_08110 [Chthonomonadaceae bacterium]|nr:hypothetical protein [Chthonomonadaceae bacterium]